MTYQHNLSAHYKIKKSVEKGEIFSKRTIFVALFLFFDAVLYWMHNVL